MSDYNSSLPVRTEANGDVVIRLVDGAVTSQFLAIDAAGLLGSKLFDAAGNGITSQLNGAQQALDVGINVAGVQIDPRQIRALTAADVVTVDQGTSPWITKDLADGSVTGGTAGTFSALAGAIYNSTPLTLTDGQQAALQSDVNGRLLVATISADDHNYGVVGANTLRTAAQIGNATGAADFNFGVVGAQTLRTASEIGNATGAASFGAGVTSAQTLRVAANLYDETGTPFSESNPLPVTIDTISGTVVADYKDASSIAAGASDNHDYTVTAGKTLYFDQVIASASGKAKMEVAIETGVATGIFNTSFVQFNSTADTNMSIWMTNALTVAAGVRVRVIMSNRDNQAQDLYSTIMGHEV